MKNAILIVSLFGFSLSLFAQQNQPLASDLNFRTRIPESRFDTLPPTGAKNNTPLFEPAPYLDLTPPEITCLIGLSVNIMPTGMIQLWAQDFLYAVSDDVTPVDQIQLGVRKAGTGFGFPLNGNGNPNLSVIMDCDKLGTNGLELWARDQAGNANHCLAYVIVQDNMSNCTQQPQNWLLRVCAKTETVEGVEEISIAVTGSNPNQPFYFENLSADYNDGCGYANVPLGSDVTFGPLKDDNPLNGVTTYDKVLIARHIEGIEKLNSPYKMIAADADRNGVIDYEDIEEIENLILGIYTEFPNNTSWRFVDKTYVFPDPENPFANPFPETITVHNIQAPVSAEFQGIKIGDVNNSAVANGSGQKLNPRNLQQEFQKISIGIPSPNPVYSGSTLPLYLPSAALLEAGLFDLTGIALWNQEFSLEKGSHMLEIPAAAMPGAGMYIWQVKVGDTLRTGKLLKQ